MNLEQKKQHYKDRLVTAAEAVTHIKSGDRVMVGHAVGEPTTLVNAMCDNYQNYRNVEIMHEVLMGEGRYCAPEMAGYFYHNALFVGARSRPAVNSGRAGYMPGYFHTIPRLIKDGELKINVASYRFPPDRHGYCSLGVSVDYIRQRSPMQIW